MKRERFRAAAAAVLLLGLSLGVCASETRRYAVLSLVGDQLLIVKYVVGTGSRLDRNERQFVALDDPAIDHAAVLAVDEALRRLDPAAKPVLLSAREPALFTAQAQALDDDGDVGRLLEPIRRVMGEGDATHLILVTKYRHAAALRLERGHVGSGFLEGVGFYIDPAMMVKRSDTGERARGFLAPFAYFRISLIDLAGGRVIKEERVIASTSHSAAHSESGGPWEALSAQDKVRVLQGLIRRETARVIPALIGAS